MECSPGKDKTEEIYQTLMGIYEVAENEGIGTHTAADRVAEHRIFEARRIERT